MAKIGCLVAGLLLVAGLTGCGETCVPTLSCNKGGKVQSCCASSSCHYKASDGTDFPCGGSDCSKGSPSAAQKAADWCLTH